MLKRSFARSSPILIRNVKNARLYHITSKTTQSALNQQVATATPFITYNSEQFKETVATPYIKVDIPASSPPKSIYRGSKAWTADTLSAQQAFQPFTKESQKELRNFTKEFIKTYGVENFDNAQINQTKLTSVGKEMKKFEARVKEELGFVIIKGVPGLDTIHEKRLASIAMTSFLGDLIPQNADGVKAILVYDRDPGKYTKDGGRYHQTHEGGSLHSDNVNVPEVWDYMILSCLHPPLLGGESIMVSVPSICNYLQSHAPKALDTLTKPFLWEYRGFMDAFYKAPIIFYENDQPHIRYLRNYMESAHSRLNQPLTSEQRFALDSLDAVANLSELQFRFTMEPGDMLLAYDTQVLHGRTAFVDPSPASQAYDLNNPQNRLLQRTWAKWRNAQKN